MSTTRNTGDRTVHARWAQMEVVRYDRTGKWYLEPVGTSFRREKVTIREAAACAVWAVEKREGTVFSGLPGGGRFDYAVRDLQRA